MASLRLCGLAILLHTGVAVADPAPNRVALVIGNGAYTDVPALPNPPTDAAAIGRALKDVGFTKVTVATNLNHQALFDALRTFSNDSATADWSVLYYAGHGIEVDGKNYLVPIDAHLAADRDVEFEAVPMQTVLTAVGGARQLRLVILDACRDDPFLKKMKRANGTRSIERGLARTDPQGDLYVVYSAKSGQVALDGDKGKSPFVDALLRNIETPGLELNLVFRKVHADVSRATNGQQEPAFEGTLPGEELYFKPGASTGPPAIVAAIPKPPPPEPQPPPPVAEPPARTATLEPDPVPPPVVQAPPAATRYSYVAGLDPRGDNFLALRDRPGGGVLRTMGPGTLLAVTSRSGPWAKVVLADGTTGWAFAQYIQCCASGPVPSRADVTPTRTAPAGATWSYVAGLDPNGDNFLALKSAPDTGARRLSKLGPRTLLRVVGRSGAWLRVEVKDGGDGWVFGKYVACCVADD